MSINEQCLYAFMSHLRLYHFEPIPGFRVFGLSRSMQARPVSLQTAGWSIIVFPMKTDPVFSDPAFVVDFSQKSSSRQLSMLDKTGLKLCPSFRWIRFV
jgi:hypothetical protein